MIIMLSMKELRFTLLVGVILVFCLSSGILKAERLKDIATVAGVRSNQLIGYGIVVGLEGTGDQTSQAPFTEQSLRSILTRLGVTVSADATLKTKNVAAVALHAELPPFAKPGQMIDVTVSSIGNAKSLRGGTLIMSPLKGIDDQIYAIAQGNVIVNGFGAQSKDGSSITVNIPSVGRIPNGAMIERTLNTPFGTDTALVLNLHRPDFTTATRVAEAINKLFGPGSAQSIDAASIRVSAPQERSQRVAFVSILENVKVQPGHAPARVIVNSRTGTVVIGQHVRVLPAAISHGSLTLTITETQTVSQPQGLSQGQTAILPSSNIRAEQSNNRMFLLNAGVSLNEIVRAINQVGVSPGDLVAILEALKAAGALRAQLMVI